MPRFRAYPPPVPDHPLYVQSIAEARAMQDALRVRIDIADRFGPIRTLAGIDVGYDIAGNRSRASIALFSYPGLMPLLGRIAYLPTGFPYVPGLLAFREIPVVLEALRALPEPPDLLMVDGQGIAHPRRMGIATHLGLLTDIPAIGVAKSRLCGRHDEPGSAKGDFSLLMDGAERIGTVLRSRDDTRPLYISPGHRVSQEAALGIVLSCLTRYRLPEPTRIADKYSKIGSGALDD